MYQKKIGATTALVLAVALSACGGGGGSASYSPEPPISSQPEVPNTDNPNQPGVSLPSDKVYSNNLVAMCSVLDTNCGSLNHSMYAGDGTGIWNYVNETSSPVTIQFNISNVNNKSVTKSIVSLNDSATSDIKNVNLSVNPKVSSSIASDELSDDEKVRKFKDGLHQKELEMKKMLEPGSSKSLKNRMSSYSIANYWNVGDKQGFNKIQTDQNVDQMKSFTVADKAALPDGRDLYIWVEDTEFQGNKIIPSDVTSIKNHVLSVYGSLISLNGDAYKDFSAKYNNLIGDTIKQPIHIMLTNMNYDNRGFGVLGYFASVNSFLKQTYANSNEALQVFLDTETIYLNQGVQLNPSNPQDNIKREEFLDVIKSTFTHEVTHLMLYTQRVFANNALHESFSSESFAESAEDILRGQSQLANNFFLTSRVVYFNTSSGSQCKFDNWSCSNAYEKASVLMAFLVRKYGVGFYKDVTQDYVSTNAFSMFDSAIKKNGGKSLADELMKFQVLRAGLKGKAVNGFDLPGISSQGFNLLSYNNSIPTSRNLSNPNILGGLGGSWFRTDVTSNPKGEITLPAKSAFVLVVQ